MVVEKNKYTYSSEVFLRIRGSLKFFCCLVFIFTSQSSLLRPSNSKAKYGRMFSWIKILGNVDIVRSDLFYMSMRFFRIIQLSIVKDSNVLRGFVRIRSGDILFNVTL